MSSLDSRHIKVNKAQLSHEICPPGETDNVKKTASDYRDM